VRDNMQCKYCNNLVDQDSKWTCNECNDESYFCTQDCLDDHIDEDHGDD